MSKTIGIVFEYPLLAAAQIESTVLKPFALNGLSVVAAPLKLLQIPFFHQPNDIAVLAKKIDAWH